MSGKADLECRVKSLERQLELKEQSFHEERKELEAENKLLITSNSGLTAQMAGLEEDVHRLEQQVGKHATLEERMQNLEQRFQGQGQGKPLCSEQIHEPDRLTGKEKSIDMTFGDDTSPHLLEKFVSHYKLVDRINQERGV